MSARPSGTGNEYLNSAFVKRQADVLRATYGQGARLIARRHAKEAVRLRRKEQSTFWADVLKEIETGIASVIGTPQQGILP